MSDASNYILINQSVNDKNVFDFCIYLLVCQQKKNGSKNIALTSQIIMILVVKIGLVPLQKNVEFIRLKKTL